MSESELELQVEHTPFGVCDYSVFETITGECKIMPKPLAERTKIYAAKHIKYSSLIEQYKETIKTSKHDAKKIEEYNSYIACMKTTQTQLETKIKNAEFDIDRAAPQLETKIENARGAALPTSGAGGSAKKALIV